MDTNGNVSASGGRLSNGRFGKGHSCSKGPRGRWNKLFRDRIAACYTEQDVDNVLFALRDAALSHEVDAIKLFLSYTVGPAPLAVEFSGSRIVKSGDDEFIDGLYARTENIPGAHEAIGEYLMNMGNNDQDNDNGKPTLMIECDVKDD